VEVLERVANPGKGGPGDGERVAIEGGKGSREGGGVGGGGGGTGGGARRGVCECSIEASGGG